MQGREEVEQGLTRFVRARDGYADARAYRIDIEGTLRNLLGSTSATDMRRLEDDADRLSREQFALKHGINGSKMCDAATLAHIGVVSNGSELAARSTAVERYRQMLAAPTEIARLDAEIRSAQSASASSESAFKLGGRNRNGCLFAVFVFCIVAFILGALLGLLVFSTGNSAVMLMQSVWGLILTIGIFLIVRIRRGKDIVQRQEGARSAKIADLAQRKAAWEGVLNDPSVIPCYYDAIDAMKPQYVETCKTLMDMLRDARASELSKLTERDEASSAIGLHEEYFDAADELRGYIAKNRAGSLPEAINLYHEEKRKEADSAKLRESLERQARAKEQERDHVVSEEKKRTAAAVSGEAARTATTIAGQFAQYKVVKDHYQGR